MRKVAVIALGCPKNTVEAEYLLGILENKGYILTNNTLEADIVIIHTCSFIKDARIESENRIKEILELKSEKDLKVYVSGCLPQLLKEEFANSFPGVDGFTGTGELSRITRLMARKNKTGKLLLKPGGLNDSKFRLLSSPLPFAYLKIAEGCNHNCSFCIIPSLRGKYVSRTVSSLADEAKALSDSGVKELIIIAQDTTSYGKDLYNRFVLDKLLAKLAKIEELKIIRLMYAYPSSVTDGLLDVIKEYDNICKYMDIPIQHASKNVLANMKRPLNTVKIIEKINKRVPDIVLRTSLITGFPGETERDIKELERFIKQGYFQYAGVFEYSGQKEAPSFKLKNRVDLEKAKERKIFIENAQYEVFKKKAGVLKNKKIEFMAESCKKSGGRYIVSGRSFFQAPEIDGNIIIRSKKPVNLGGFYSAEITGNEGYDVTAKFKV
ncbi:MAG: 30S ribosomal protein S12 methylthiotransferase RimO [Endomicrobia bacterium]|nr:30S ribosomal protein S12 methylthiotransferase RimO [Endomicrobiia bacterium]MCL2799880.1 30S ribosomal protein S12 methylthiotransferase RimO [Endomicrobiia bacterium]